MTLVAEDVVRAPRMVTRVWLDRKGEPRDVLTKEPTGFYVETTFRHWRCRCGKRAVTVGAYSPAPTCCGR